MTARYQNFSTMQVAIHKNLTSVVNRYAQTEYKRPIPFHQHQAWALINNFIGLKKNPLILDSGCGTGLSSINLALQHQDHLVIGIDKSQARLSRSAPLPHNCMLVRAELVDMWRLFADKGLSFAKHYMLYPNPWPKIGHLKRRFYAHPAFKNMLSLAPYFELRTNWEIYALECLQALELLGQQATLSLKEGNKYISLFEKKYIESGCRLYVIINIFNPYTASHSELALPA